MPVAHMLTARAKDAKSSTKDVLISAEDISVVVDGKTLIDTIRFTLVRGQMISIIGPNGGGKSTLIKAVAGLMPISQGRILKTKGIRLGLVPQNFVIPSSLPLRVADFLNLNKPFGRMSQTETNGLYRALDINHLLKQDMQNLSGGERQRVLLANCLKQKPDVLLLDEPMQGVDAASAHILYEQVHNAARDHDCGVLMVSHDLHWVMAGTQHVLCINTHLCCQGAPSHVQASSEFQALFNTPHAFYAHHHDCEHEHDCEPHMPHASSAKTLENQKAGT